MNRIIKRDLELEKALKIQPENLVSFNLISSEEQPNLTLTDITLKRLELYGVFSESQVRTLKKNISERLEIFNKVLKLEKEFKDANPEWFF